MHTLACVRHTSQAHSPTNQLRHYMALRERESACRPVLVFKVRGGLNNQKECLINAAIAAHLLSHVTLALPHLDFIGRGNEKFEP